MGNRKTWSTEPEDGETNCRTLRGGCCEGGGEGCWGAGGEREGGERGRIRFFFFIFAQETNDSSHILFYKHGLQLWMA